MTRTHGTAPRAWDAVPEDNAATKPPVLAAQCTADQRHGASTDAWARDQIAHADGPIPPYGTSVWERLPDGPTKTAAAVIAAQRWRHRRGILATWSPDSGRRARELAEARRARPGDHTGGPVPLWGPGGAA